MIYLRTTVAALLISLLVLPFPAQSEPTETKTDPYIKGETLSYVGKLRRLGILTFTLAELNFEVNGKTDDGDYSITSVGRSRGSLTRLFNFKFLLKIDTLVDSNSLQVLKTTKRDEQGDRIRDSVADFDYDAKAVTYIESDPNEPSKAPRRVASDIVVDTQDIVSAVYRLRGMDLAVGKRFLFKVSDSGLVYDVPVKITKRERIKSKLGKRWCFRVEPEIFGPGKILEQQEGSLTIWITDDVDRVPVKAKLDTRVGNVTIKLKKFGNLKSSVTPSRKE